MGLSCSCDDFDAADYESWWEGGGLTVPPAGARCCECGAHLPVTEECETIEHYEVYEPDEPAPRAPWDVDADEMDDAAFAAIEDAWDAYCDRLGWDSDRERFERHSGSEYRCERCSDLAAAITGMGYCTIRPGELIQAHTEYVNETQELAPGVARREIIWSRNKDGVWHPRRKTNRDRRIEAWERRGRRVRYWLIEGGWRFELRWKVWFPAQTRVMRALGYRYTYVRHDAAARKSVYRWQREPKRPPPWVREAERGDRT